MILAGNRLILPHFQAETRRPAAEARWVCVECKAAYRDRKRSKCASRIPDQPRRDRRFPPANLSATGRNIADDQGSLVDHFQQFSSGGIRETILAPAVIANHLTIVQPSRLSRTFYTRRKGKTLRNTFPFLVQTCSGNEFGECTDL